MKTYTAGEDQGRLAEMAKEFGLARHRAPRQQVRARTAARGDIRRLGVRFNAMIHDHTVEDARMRAVWSSHQEREDDDELSEGRKMQYDRLYSWEEEDFADEEDGEVAEDAHAPRGFGSDLTSCVFGIVKGMVGPAILFLPHGFASAGWAAALPIMAVSVISFLYSCDCLSKSWKIESDREKIKANSERTLLIGEASKEEYGGSATEITSHRQKPGRVILSYPELAYRALGSKGELLLKAGITLLQSGVCLTYCIFVPQNLHVSMKLLTGWDVAPNYWLIVMIVIQVPLSWIRDIRHLTVTNLLAMVLILFGLITCLGFAFAEATSDPSLGAMEEMQLRLSNLAPVKSHWYLFIGTGLYMFEGSITLMVPLQEALHGEETRAKFPRVYTWTTLSVTIFYAFFSIICWMGFGDDVRTVLTVSLPSGWLATTVQLTYSIAVVFTFPLQNFPALEITCRLISTALRPCTKGQKVWWTSRNLFASVQVVLLAVLAIAAMDTLGMVVSLLGSLLGCPIALIFPPLIHNILDQNMSKGRRLGNNLTIVVGTLAMIISSFLTVITW